VSDPDPAAAGPVVVVGAGVAGVMTARALARRGREVVVLDALPAPAGLCSHANAGILAVGHARAWAAPSAVGALLRALAGRDPSLRVTRPMDPALWGWGLAFLHECTPRAHRANTARLQKLSRLGRSLLPAAEAEMALPPETRREGGLYLFQDRARFDRHAASLRGDDSDAEVLDRAALLAREPALARLSERLVGGLYSPADAVGDCRLFVERTCGHLRRTNRVALRFDRRVTGFRRAGRRIEAVETDRGPLPCAGIVLATGVETPALTDVSTRASWLT
tara:strand:- start:3190 stop:4026 length:837 start_codon:yes stop_codon:yes gene_type:complete